VVALAGRRLEGVLIALPAPAALLLTYVEPSNRALGWAGMLLAVVALGAAVRAARGRTPADMETSTARPSGP
jgi:uncharacterized membrane protein